MRAQRFLATAGAAVVLTAGAITPAYAETGADDAAQPTSEQQSSPSSANNENPVKTEAPAEGELSPAEQAEFDLRKQELSTEQAKLSIDSVKSVLKVILFFTGVGIPLALAL